ncbi:hypothetical protein CEXT_301461 [Caerostris extrusa]|uniref:Uncharacterized protein n=1 Tax=Caerostris extrusa TaxID=172846 RepID=A0AAV4Q2H2_CAEEX|nr:hypothetical protein CEXT_301461 [Caerostris extrusa]
MLSSSIRVTSATIVCYCCHHLTLLRATFSAVNVSNYCHRLLLLPSSSIRVTSTTIVSHCYRHLTLLRATSFVAVLFYFVGLSLLPSSSTATVIFYCYHRLPLLLSPAAIVRLPLLSSSSSATHDDFERNIFLPSLIDHLQFDKELLKIIQ